MAKHFDSVAAAVGAEIRRLRLLHGMTLKDLGAKAGLDFSQLSKIERGVGGTELEKLRDVAQALGVPLAKLFRNAPRASRLSSHGSTVARIG